MVRRLSPAAAERCTPGGAGRTPNLAGVVLLLLLLLLSSAGAQVDPFAGLTIVPFGEQIFDIATGMTTLPDGGEVVDRATGIVLSAPYILLQEGVFIEARDAEASGDFGTFRADTLTVDLGLSLLLAEGDLEVVREGQVVRSERLTYFAEARVLRISGGVVGENPMLSATAIVLDVDSGGSLLVSPYSFEDDLVTLRSNLEGSLLELTPVELDGLLTFDAATEVNPETLARLEPYLP